MGEVVLCGQPMRADLLNSQCGINPASIHGISCKNPSSLHAFTPYMLGENLDSYDLHIMRALSQPKVAQNLTNLSLSFGEDNVLALAEITKKLQEYNVGLMGSSTSVYANRVGGFVGAVQEYQDTLMAYREAVKSNSASKALAKQKALTAFEKLQTQFRNELKIVNAGVKSRRGTPLSNPVRGTNIARSSRNVAKLDITSQAQAHNLVKFTQHARVLGNGLAVIDFTSRIGNIQNEYKAGGNWERELFIESTSFAASAMAGSIVVDAGLTLLLAATPAGWVALVVAGGIAVAGAAASIGMNDVIKNNSGSAYDSIMKWISGL